MRRPRDEDTTTTELPEDAGHPKKRMQRLTAMLSELESRSKVTNNNRKGQS